MALPIELPPDMENFIKSEVASGRFATASELVTVALDRMREHETRSRAFRAAVQVGIDEIDRGEGVVWADNTMRDLIAEVIRERDREAPLNPDVLP